MSAAPSSDKLTILERIPSGEATTYLVPSDRDPATVYSLVVVRGRPLSCTCLGFVHYQKPCKHMRALGVYLEQERRAAILATHRKAARCPICDDYKQHGDLMCDACYRAAPEPVCARCQRGGFLLDALCRQCFDAHQDATTPVPPRRPRLAGRCA